LINKSYSDDLFTSVLVFLALFCGIPIIVIYDLKIAIAIMAKRAIFGHFGHYGHGNFQVKNYNDWYPQKERYKTNSDHVFTTYWSKGLTDFENHSKKNRDPTMQKWHVVQSFNGPRAIPKTVSEPACKMVKESKRAQRFSKGWPFLSQSDGGETHSRLLLPCQFIRHFRLEHLRRTSPATGRRRVPSLMPNIPMVSLYSKTLFYENKMY